MTQLSPHGEDNVSCGRIRTAVVVPTTFSSSSKTFSRECVFINYELETDRKIVDTANA